MARSPSPKVVSWYLVFNSGQLSSIVTPWHPNIDWVSNIPKSADCIETVSVNKQISPLLLQSVQLSESFWKIFKGNCLAIFRGRSYLAQFPLRSVQSYSLDFNFLEFRVGLGTELVCSELPTGSQTLQQTQPVRLFVWWWSTMGGLHVRMADSPAHPQAGPDTTVISGEC